jgi:hypothetical protein
LLTLQRLLELARAATTAELTPESLYTGLPVELVADLPRLAKPSEKLLADLQILNSVGALRVWLLNAEHLAEPRAEVAVFRQALAWLDADPGGREPAPLLFPAASGGPIALPDGADLGDLRALRRTLARLVPDPGRIPALAAAVGLGDAPWSSGGDVDVLWSELIQAARRRGPATLERLVAEVRAAFPHEPALIGYAASGDAGSKP